MPYACPEHLPDEISNMLSVYKNLHIYMTKPDFNEECDIVRNCGHVAKYHVLYIEDCACKDIADYLPIYKQEKERRVRAEELLQREVTALETIAAKINSLECIK